jgi:hypothetical protein
MGDGEILPTNNHREGKTGLIILFMSDSHLFLLSAYRWRGIVGVWSYF